MTIPVINANFSDIDNDGKINIYRHEIPQYLTVGNLVILTNPATSITKYATLYESGEDFYSFRLQD